ncbi:hypothetical protein ACIQM4_17720 [Streptomyces sp. NPDC091272]|uniref:hypothetical protein n=1 Tax=Streptomyces sp. NPDC091272 TaxID=3365981 RepID=UPI0037F76CD2
MTTHTPTALHPPLVTAPPRPHAPAPALDRVTASGAAWLASASAYPRSTLSAWEARPAVPAVLPCGTAFDVVNVPAVFGRRMLDALWADGPGSGPVAEQRGRMLLLTVPGTAQRLPALLRWERRAEHVPPLLCHGTGDAVTVPALAPGPEKGPRWVVAPDVRHPWLPGPEVMFWACVRASRLSIFPPADQSANVYDVSRRR